MGCGSDSGHSTPTEFLLQVLPELYMSSSQSHFHLLSVLLLAMLLKEMLEEL